MPPRIQSGALWPEPENPLAAALIGGGALWLLLGNERLKNAASSVSAGTAPLADIGSNLRCNAPKFVNSPLTAPEMDHPASQHLGETLHKATSPTSGAAAGAADGIKNSFDEAVAYARDSFSKVSEALPRKETVTKVQSSLSNLLERQPLVLGALGLALGAVVAGAFRRSDIENEMNGPVNSVTASTRI